MPILLERRAQLCHDLELQHDVPILQAGMTVPELAPRDPVGGEPPLLFQMLEVRSCAVAKLDVLDAFLQAEPDMAGVHGFPPHCRNRSANVDRRLEYHVRRTQG